jgi:pullulanase
MLKVKRLTLSLMLLLPMYNIYSQELWLSPTAHAVPGAQQPTDRLLYQNASATSVVVAGSWDTWTGRYSMVKNTGGWELDTKTVPAPFGRHEFKFIVNDQWEQGDNRFLYFNTERMLEKPSDLITSATIDDTNLVTISLRQALAGSKALTVKLEPDIAIKEWALASPREDARRQGYFISGGLVTFVFDPAVYGLTLPPNARVTVAGNFNGWDSSGGGGRWTLRDDHHDGLYEVTTQLQGLRPPAGEKTLVYKFVIDGSRWLPPPAKAINALSDGKGNTNLKLDPTQTGSAQLKIVAVDALDLSQPLRVAIDGLRDRTLRYALTPGDIMAKLKSDKPLGVTLDKKQKATTYRLFAPRSSQVYLCIFSGPEYEVYKPEHKRLKPMERYPMWKDPADGVWEISLLGLDVGKYYSFNVEGPSGDGEAFNPLAQVGDPYALAAAHAHNNSIVIDPEASNEWFQGWSDAEHVTTAPVDTIIYEAHVRDMTKHPSSGVDPQLRGTYAGLLASLGTGTGLDHLKELGVTTIELLPTAEYSNTPGEYNWGYAPVFYFAPDGDYARKPLTGSQYYEFKHLVNELHRQGFNVILDVVFNHVGSPNLFAMIDKKYFFRLNPDFTFSNYSACGNDVRTEAPMMRRLIVDNILYWMKEFHVDGFRFDLAELVDLDTLMAVRDAARALNPNVLLISEPWSFRGENKHQLKGTGWSAWNNDFRYAAKDFAMGRRNRDWLKKTIFGSVENWTTSPLQAINYLESHDDMALADEFCTRPDRDGRNLMDLDVSANRLAATILFTSLGIPMISEGQEFLRSKWGFHNSFDRGDDVNAIRWTDRDRPMADEALAYYKALIHLRQSPAGAAFRVAQKPPAGYYQWITPPNDQVLGYIVNAPRIHAGNGFIVLLNGGADASSVDVSFPPGNWRQIGDGLTLNPEGLPEAKIIQGPCKQNIQLTGIKSLIFMDGF